MMTDCVRSIENILVALSNIEVKGESNLNLLLASIQALKRIRDDLEKEDAGADHP